MNNSPYRGITLTPLLLSNPILEIGTFKRLTFQKFKRLTELTKTNKIFTNHFLTHTALKLTCRDSEPKDARKTSNLRGLMGQKGEITFFLLSECSLLLCHFLKESLKDLADVWNSGQLSQNTAKTISRLIKSLPNTAEGNQQLK